MDPMCLRYCSLYMQTILEKCPFQENGKLPNLFLLNSQGLSLPAGSDTPQNKSCGVLDPHKTRSCGVSDPTELGLARFQIPQNNESVHFIADACSAGLDTQPKKVLPGVRPWITKFCGLSNPGEHLLNTNISTNSKQNSKIFQRVNSGTICGRFVEKTRGRKSHASVPLSSLKAKLRGIKTYFPCDFLSLNFRRKCKIQTLFFSRFHKVLTKLRTAFRGVLSRRNAPPPGI